MNKNFERILDDKIRPLVDKMVSLQGSTIPLASRRKEIYDMFATAVLAGVNLSEQTDEQLGKGFERMIEEHFEKPKSNLIVPEASVANTMAKHKKEKDYAAKLSMQKGGKMEDGTPRYVTADQFDPNTGKYKGNK